MFAMITTDEYKELILAQQENAEYQDIVIDLDIRRQGAEDNLKEVEEELKDLLLLLMKGEKRVPWAEGKYETFDLAGREETIAYINKHYVWNGELQFRKVKNNDEVKENEDE